MSEPKALDAILAKINALPPERLDVAFIEGCPWLMIQADTEDGLELMANSFLIRVIADDVIERREIGT